MFKSTLTSRGLSILSILVLLSLALAACSPAATTQPTDTTAPTAVPATATNAPTMATTATNAPTMATTATIAATMGTTATMAPTSAPMATPTGPATVKVANNATLGNILVDANGMTLYLYAKDTTGVSNCTGACQTNWPPFLTNGTPVSGDTTITGVLGTITLPDGSTQVTIGGFPLYYYASDNAAGDANGQGLGGGNWHVVQIDGTPKM